MSGAAVGQVMPVERFAGADRVATAVALARAVWGRSAPRVVVASAANYPDALAASALTGVLDAPLLLTAPDVLSSAVREALAGFGTTQVTVVGGPAAVSPEVVAELEGMGLAVERLAGPDRFATAVAIAEEVLASPLAGTGVYVVEGAHADPGRGWPDAVAVTAVAAASRTPVVLTTRDVLPEASVAALEGLAPSTVTVIGGPAAVSDAVVERLEEFAPVARVAGADRYATSVAVVEHAELHGLSTGWTMAVTGRNWPDALAAGSAVSRLGGQVLLVAPDRLDNDMPLAGLIGTGRVSAVGLAGGPVAISPTVEDRLHQLVGPPDGATVVHPDRVRLVSGVPLRDMVVQVPETTVTFGVGEVIASAAGDRAPEGMVGRVRSISQADADGWVSLDLEAVSLDELVPAATVQARLPFVPTSSQAGTGTRIAADSSSGSLTCSDGTQAGIQVTVTTDLAGDLNVTLDYDSDAGTFRLEPMVRLGAKVQLDLAGDATVSCSANLAKLTADWPTIVLWIGWLPVTVTPTMSASADFTMQVTGKVGASAVGTGSVTLAPFYDSDTGFGDHTTTALSGNLTPIRVEAANVETTTILKGRLGFLLWKLAGVNLGPDVGLKYTFDPCRAPTHRLDIPQSITLAMQFNDLLTELLKNAKVTAPSHTWTFDPIRVAGFGDPVPALCSGAGTFRPAMLSTGEVGENYRTRLAVKADDGTTPTHPDVTFAIDSGTLPAGLQLAADGTLSGTPTSTGQRAFVVKATIFPGTPNQVTRTHAYTLDVLDAHIQILTDQIPPLFVDQPVNFTLDADTTRELTWLNLTDDLPDGVELTADGRLTGTPTRAGTTTSSIGVWFTDGHTIGEGHRTYPIEILERIPPCSEGRLPLFDGILTDLNPSTGTAVGSNAETISVYVDGQVHTFDDPRRPHALSPSGRWLLLWDHWGEPQEQYIHDLQTGAETAIPTPSGNIILNDINDSGFAVGQGASDDAEILEAPYRVSPTGTVTELSLPPDGSYGGAYRVLADGTVLGAVAFVDGDSNIEGRATKWAPDGSPSLVRPDLDYRPGQASEANVWFVGHNPDDTSEIRVWGPDGSRSIGTIDGFHDLLVLPDGSVQRETFATPRKTYYHPATGGQIEIVIHLEPGESRAPWEYNFGHVRPTTRISSDGIVLTSVEKNEEVSTGRCLAPTS